VSVHLLPSTGRGPQECAWALARLLRRLEADATRQKLETRRVQTCAATRMPAARARWLR
jgi:peptide chain release factor